MDLALLESKLRIALERSPSVSPQEIQESINTVNTICNSLDGLQFIVNHSLNFSCPASKKFSLIVCKNWCMHRWSELSNELKNQLKEFLFFQSLQNFDSIPQDFQNVIGDAQCSYMWNSFLTEWPSFWDDLLKMPPIVVLNFLNAFCSLTSTMHQDSNQTFTQIKQTVRSQETDKDILLFVFNVLNLNGPLCFSILASLIHWISLDFILNNDSMSLLINALNNPQTASPALNALTSLIERGMETEMKMQIIEMLQIPPRVISLICNNADNTIIYSAAQLIENTGSLLISTPKALPFFQIALQLLTNLDNEISGCVASFIQQYTKSYPEVAPIVMNTCYSRLKEYYNFIENEDEPYCDMLFGIIRACFSVNHDDSLQFLLSICESMDIIGEMPHCVALLEILNDQQPQPEFVQYFEPLLSLTPPLSPHHTKALGSYVRFFTSVAGAFDITTISTFFARISQFALSPMIREETRTFLSFSLLGFTKKYNNIHFDQNTIFSFVQTFDPNLISIAALLISRLDQNQYEIFQSCVSHLFSKLQANIGICPLVLHFIKSLHYNQGSPHIPIVLGFLTQIKQYVKSDDQLQAQFIRTSFYSLGPESCNLINECIPSSTERLSISALSDVSNTTVKLFKNNEFSINLAYHMFDSFVKCFNEIDDWSIVNDNTIEVIQMVDDYLSLCASIILETSPEFSQKLLLFVSNSLSPKYFCYQLFLKFYSFISHISKVIPDVSLQSFGVVSITALLSNINFNPTHPGWSKVITKLAKFQAYILSSIHDSTIQIIATTLAQLNATEQMTRAYIEILQLSPRQRNENIVSFCNDFMKYKKSLC
ncbi:hypothetical protein TRFO_20144 [Tritrichomonas foetus]|uniref:Exportin-T n=1 Tax=Tritrichomonas foetus TaxID=1144522 RepID=A0A1J4KH24_9EUKA|nr:hypothetical protein TRFO_20144 [Tritrichomonas foetus]|eukprot:OHT10483.1 hypothetical protein TRFO_20144 [Tritrichomonas foetus]